MTAECAAGVLPADMDLRPQDQIDTDSCELVCSALFIGPVLPWGTTAKELLSSTLYWGGTTAAGNLSCKWICKDPNRRSCLLEGR